MCRSYDKSIVASPSSSPVTAQQHSLDHQTPAFSPASSSSSGAQLQQLSSSSSQRSLVPKGALPPPVLPLKSQPFASSDETLLVPCLRALRIPEPSPLLPCRPVCPYISRCSAACLPLLLLLRRRCLQPPPLLSSHCRLWRWLRRISCTGNPSGVPHAAPPLALLLQAHRARRQRALTQPSLCGQCGVHHLRLRVESVEQC